MVAEAAAAERIPVLNERPCEGGGMCCWWEERLEGEATVMLWMEGLCMSMAVGGGGGGGGIVMAIS